MNHNISFRTGSSLIRGKYTTRTTLARGVSRVLLWNPGGFRKCSFCTLGRLTDPLSYTVRGWTVSTTSAQWCHTKVHYAILALVASPGVVEIALSSMHAGGCQIRPTMDAYIDADGRRWCKWFIW